MQRSPSGEQKVCGPSLRTRLRRGRKTEWILAATETWAVPVRREEAAGKGARWGGKKETVGAQLEVLHMHRTGGEEGKEADMSFRRLGEAGC